MYHEVGVVIPYYHCDLKETELISLQQCIKVLKDYPFIFVVPDSMREEDYPKVPGAIFEKIPKEWLSSVKTYNQMMLKEEFYERFIKYKFILIYQLDAFVFSDRLLEMCQYDYDYIGAPWLRGLFYYISAEKCIWRVGNGGLSLRKVRSVLALLKKGCKSDFFLNEDIFFSISDSDTFRVAPLEIALKFAFETELERCFELNNREIPFGCHAWERYNFSFWKPFIEKCGYNTDMIDINANEDQVLQYKYIQQKETAFFWEKIFSREWFAKELEKLFLKPVKSYIIWGVGKYGKELIKIFNDTGLPIKFLVDSNKKLIGENQGGYEIKGADEMQLSRCDAVVVAIKNKGDEVAEQLKLQGYIRRVDYILLEDIQTIIKTL